ncbi:hypothetical protein QR680_018925 [Steinernema hermaphroditum]|uniref:F-box domain-containing protein n=1 Tax=Steinernema hermaphroditum TaxID=289476 RepID=A0AA39HKS5_9BILA|nr:hypothetical protein QR680_018925 [Steinernema hermaphroditum]
MDQVPHKFIDRVVGLLASESLSAQLHCANWRTVFKEHSHNQKFYFVDICVRDEQVHCDINYAWKHRRLSRQEALQLDCRYSRFTKISNDRCYPRNTFYGAKSKPSTLIFKKDQMESLSKFLLRYTNGMDCNYGGLCDDFNQAFVNDALRKVAFQYLSLNYYGQSSEDFLKDHIDNLPHGGSLTLNRNWPASIVHHIMKACLSERYCIIDVEHVKELISDTEIFELLRRWRAGKKFQCKLRYVPKPGEGTYAKSWTLHETPFRTTRYLRDERRKSLVHYMKTYDSVQLDFMICLCNTWQYCQYHQLRAFQTRWFPM